MADRHRGMFVGGWVSQETADRLAELAAISGLTKTRTIEKLINGREIRNKSYVKLINEISRLGGLIKHKANGDREICRLGHEIVKIAKDLKEQPCPPSSPSA